MYAIRLAFVNLIIVYHQQSNNFEALINVGLGSLYKQAGECDYNVTRKAHVVSVVNGLTQEIHDRIIIYL